jgi:hypothetical protein
MVLSLRVGDGGCSLPTPQTRRRPPSIPSSSFRSLCPSFPRLPSSRYSRCVVGISRRSDVLTCQRSDGLSPLESALAWNTRGWGNMLTKSPTNLPRQSRAVALFPARLTRHEPRATDMFRSADVTTFRRLDVPTFRRSVHTTSPARHLYSWDCAQNPTHTGGGGTAHRSLLRTHCNASITIVISNLHYKTLHATRGWGSLRKLPRNAQSSALDGATCEP